MVQFSTTTPTAPGPPPPTASERYVQSGTLFLFFSLALLGNSLVVARLAQQLYCRRSRRLNTVSLLCLQLGLADILAAFCCILSNAVMYLLDEWLAGNTVCKLLKFLQRLGLAGSTFIVVTISVDRYLAIRYPMRRRWDHEGVLMVGLIWFLAGLFSLPQMLVFKVSNVPVNGVETLQCAGFDESAVPWQEFTYDLALLLVLYVCPIGVIVTCYSLILRRIGQESHKGDQMLPAECSLLSTALGREKLYKQARNTSLIMSVLVIVTFIICWAPFYMALIVHLAYKPAPFENYYYNHAIYFCGLGHSVLNPLFYGAFHIIRRARRDTSNAASRINSSRIRSNTTGTSSRHLHTELTSAQQNSLNLHRTP
ncbi:gonadotropin-releasing hormone receptor-like [Paramacrobiotus metropolitanus]|uniref:gonadotropin-releasing hormone receptor-like n=1 Tax=Paramacrobiotus metropolitanus TaxID=2943436 RepID=UPI0024462F9E|nr:gonadotropin-releasing hormone receptor-like [Paramacrobiotus metropolitanus]